MQAHVPVRVAVHGTICKAGSAVFAQSVSSAAVVLLIFSCSVGDSYTNISLFLFTGSSFEIVGADICLKIIFKVNAYERLCIPFDYRERETGTRTDGGL